ncbi:ATP-binding protein [Geoglobus acetivorans]|uniref:ATP-binding protein n=1 Tax=Geoglobus acetivorans TaxID=565033 RepID=A0ABZ3H6J5_GEOAI
MHGKNTSKEVREYIKAKHSDITQYLKNLMETGFVVKKVPVTENERPKRGRCFIGDTFVAFWFRYMYPNLSSNEEGIFDIEELKKDYANYLGTVFEGIARQFLIELNKRGSLPLRFSKIGGWWHKADEIDLVALNEREEKALIVEVKWRELGKNETSKILEDLREKAELIELEDYVVYWGIVARKVSERSELVGDLRDFSRVV